MQLRTLQHALHDALKAKQTKNDGNTHVVKLKIINIDCNATTVYTVHAYNAADVSQYVPEG